MCKVALSIGKEVILNNRFIFNTNIYESNKENYKKTVDKIHDCDHTLYSFRNMVAKLVASYRIDPYSRFVPHPVNSMECMEEIQKSAGKKNVGMGR
jgi:hypothetical protein